MDCKLLSSLTKVFADQEPVSENLPVAILKGEIASVQVAVRTNCIIEVTASAPGFRTVVREVRQVPVGRTCSPGLDDDNYLRMTPGLYPDLLQEMPEDSTTRVAGWWKSFWVDAIPEDGLATGDYKVTVKVRQMNGLETDETCELEHVIHYTDCALPQQKLMHTEWFHSDCLADYYHVEVFSEEYWRIVENFIRSAVDMGINMILTPMFTPPLDTQVGGERTTVQLVDVTRENGVYSFGFEKLERWVDMCKRCGVRYYELSHLYSQWGTNKAPKIMATDNGEYRKIFGWDDVATDPAYKEFLACFLPKLVEKLYALGIAEDCRFHIMDEPHGEEMLRTYLAQKAQVEPYINGLTIMDALSEYAFYEAGAVACPVVSTGSEDLPKFLASKDDLWLYYCCGPEKDGSNRFIAMPSARTRILGVQLYLYKAGGFLQWGFNFYNSQLSKKKIDPYAITDAEESFPAGDAFVVYPAPDGTARESIRYMVMRQAMCDLRALELLESMVGREKVVSMIHEGVDGEFTLMKYPRSNEYLLNLRAAVSAEIEKHL